MNELYRRSYVAPDIMMGENGLVFLRNMISFQLCIGLSNSEEIGSEAFGPHDVQNLCSYWEIPEKGQFCGGHVVQAVIAGVMEKPHIFSFDARLHRSGGKFGVLFSHLQTEVQPLFLLYSRLLHIIDFSGECEIVLRFGDLWFVGIAVLCNKITSALAEKEIYDGPGSTSLFDNLLRLKKMLLEVQLDFCSGNHRFLNKACQCETDEKIRRTI